MRHQINQNAYTYSRATPEVFFGTAARSSFGQLNTQKLTTQKGFLYADALRSGTEIPLQSNLGNAQQIQVQSQSTLESMVVTIQQSMMEFMSFMKTTMQTRVQNQNMVVLAGKQSKLQCGTPMAFHGTTLK